MAAGVCVYTLIYKARNTEEKKLFKIQVLNLNFFLFFKKISGNIDRARTHTTHTLHKQTDISYYKYPQRLDTDAYKCSADAVAGCWVVIRKKN